MKHIFDKRSDDLALCTVCKAGEGELPTECPGKPISMDMLDAIYSGILDYKNGVWVHKSKDKIL